MSGVRCYPRDEFETILTEELNLVKTDEVYDGERKWTTQEGKTIWISDIEVALTQTFVQHIFSEVRRLRVEDGPPDLPPLYPWGL